MCKICGRYACTESFHASEEQEEFDAIQERVFEVIRARIKRLEVEYVVDVAHVELQDVLDELY